MDVVFNGEVAMLIIGLCRLFYSFSFCLPPFPKKKKIKKKKEKRNFLKIELFMVNLDTEEMEN